MNRSEDISKEFREKRTKSEVLAKTKATDAQWELVSIAVRAFISKYPSQWYEFQRQLKADRTKYQLATKDHKELRQANWRNVASFPIIEDSEGNAVDSILPVLQRIIPGLTHKNSVNFSKFIKKFPFFLPGEKY